MRKSLGLAVLFLAILLVFLGPLVSARQTTQKPQTPLFAPSPNATAVEKVLTGDEIGFRISSYKNGVPVGRLVVKVDGKWVEPREAISVVPAR